MDVGGCVGGAGRLCTIVTSGGETTSFEYSAFGFVSKVVSNGLAVGYERDAGGAVTKLTYPSGRAVIYERAGGLVTAVKLQASGTTITLASNVKYEPVGPIASWTYGNGLTYQNIFDQQYWLRSVSTPGVHALSVTQRDGNGNIERLQRDGTSEMYSYDTRDRMLSADQNQRSQAFGYDEEGNRTSHLVNSVSTTSTFDHQTNRINGVGGLPYVVDPTGNTVEQPAVPGRRALRFGYSPHNRIISAADAAAPSSPIAYYRYNGLGQRTQKTAGGTTSRYVFGLSPLLLSEVQNGAIVEEYVYLEGIPLAALGPAPTASGPAPTFNETKDNSGANGDWSLASYNGATGGSYLYLDQSRQTASDSHSWTWAIPVAGRYEMQVLWVPPTNSGITSQRYYINNQYNELVSVNAGSRGTWATAPPLISLAVGSTTITLLESYNGTQRLFADAVKLRLVQVDVDPPKVTYLHADHLNAPVAATNGNKQVVWRASHDVFGAATVEQDPDGDGIATRINLRSAGQHFDAETGLHYNFHRDYDPYSGRYLESDPLGVGAGLNTFHYVGANPLSRYDTDGLRWVVAAVWEADISTRSVGHVFLGELDGTVIVSQFPNPHERTGDNMTYNWEATRKIEGRDPDHVFRLWVDDDEKMNETASELRNRPLWNWLPMNDPAMTNCVHAAHKVLEAGGRNDLWMTPTMPSQLSDALILFEDRDRTLSLPSVPWEEE